jgi:rod shape-determining protein MreC
VKTRNSGIVVRLALPLAGLAQRFYFPLLLLAAVALMLFARGNEGSIEQLQARSVDAVAPILSVISRPAASVADLIEYGRRLVDLRAENERLREENTRLTQWQQAALRLEAENKSLRSLLAYKPEPSAKAIAARVVDDNSGVFVRAAIAMAGARDGVRRGQAVMSSQGLVGRIIQAGEWSSRILLLTDLNARIPVVLESSRSRAVVGGDNGATAFLDHLPPGFEPKPGERVFTSGHGQLYPPGLPVGIVGSKDQNGHFRVLPSADLDRLEHVQIIDFGFDGNLAPAPLSPAR